MTDKWRGGPAEWRDGRPPTRPVLSVVLSVLFLTTCVKKEKKKKDGTILLGRYQCHPIQIHENTPIINHSLHFHIASGSTSVSKTSTDYCQKPETSLDKRSLQSNGKSVWNPINHGTGDWLKDRLFTNGLVSDPDKIIDCEAVRMAWLRRCIDRKL